MRRHGSPEQLQATRLQAVDLDEQGLSVAEIAEVLDRSVRSIEKWLKIAREQGREALHAKPHAGAEPKLTQQQRNKLCRHLEAGAIAAGFSTDLWTSPRVRQLIQDKYGVTYHVNYLPQLLKSLGFTRQKPQRRAAERNEEAIEHWVKFDWARIKKRPAARAQPLRSSTKAACC